MPSSIPTSRSPITGVVTKLDWVNPHAYVYLDAKTPTGEVKRYKIEMGPPYALVRGGWKRDTLKIGDTVTVEGAALPRTAATTPARCRRRRCGWRAGRSSR